MEKLFCSVNFSKSSENCFMPQRLVFAETPQNQPPPQRQETGPALTDYLKAVNLVAGAMITDKAVQAVQTVQKAGEIYGKLTLDLKKAGFTRDPDILTKLSGDPDAAPSYIERLMQDLKTKGVDETMVTAEFAAVFKKSRETLGWTQDYNEHIAERRRALDQANAVYERLLPKQTAEAAPTAAPASAPQSAPASTAEIVKIKADAITTTDFESNAAARDYILRHLSRLPANHPFNGMAGEFLGRVETTIDGTHGKNARNDLLLEFRTQFDRDANKPAPQPATVAEQPAAVPVGDTGGEKKGPAEKKERAVLTPDRKRVITAEFISGKRKNKTGDSLQGKVKDLATLESALEAKAGDAADLARKVIDLQKTLTGVTPDGIFGPLTWQACSDKLKAKFKGESAPAAPAEATSAPLAVSTAPAPAAPEKAPEKPAGFFTLENVTGVVRVSGKGPEKPPIHVENGDKIIITGIKLWEGNAVYPAQYNVILLKKGGTRMEGLFTDPKDLPLSDEQQLQIVSAVPAGTWKTKAPEMYAGKPIVKGEVVAKATPAPAPAAPAPAAEVKAEPPAAPAKPPTQPAPAETVVKAPAVPPSAPVVASAPPAPAKPAEVPAPAPAAAPAPPSPETVAVRLNVKNIEEALRTPPEKTVHERITALLGNIPAGKTATFENGGYEMKNDNGTLYVKIGLTGSFEQANDTNIGKLTAWQKSMREAEEAVS